MKYIVKNCPALSYGKGLRFKKCYRTNWNEYCQDCPDCVIKRIVELCEEELKPVYILTGNLTAVSTPCYKGGYNLAQDILKHLEIEEVE